METTRLSEKGQIVIPKRVRTARGWKPGLQFSVESFEDGIKLRPVRAFQGTAIEDVLGCIPYKGPRKTLKEMEAAIAEGARHAADGA